jgi:predicted transcriptional regulator
MHEKRLLQRDDTSRSHIYSPTLKENETQSVLLDKLLKTAFNGSALKLVMQALGSHKASQEELLQIREYLDQLERGQNESTE